MKTTKHTLSYYSYGTAKVTILWRNKVQPLGIFKSAENAINELRKIGANLADYSLNCDGEIIELQEYL